MKEYELAVVFRANAEQDAEGIREMVDSVPRRCLLVPRGNGAPRVVQLTENDS